jgi:hypothetical protein
MIPRTIRTALLASALSLAIAACGGAGGGTNSTGPAPSPPPAPAPQTPSSSFAPLSAPPAGVTETTELASYGVIDNVRWNASSQAYEVTFSGQAATIEAILPAAPYAQAGRLRAFDGTLLPPTLQAWTGLAYTRSGYVTGSDNAFAFGLATPAGGVPVTGMATYTADLTGGAFTPEGTAVWGLYGSAKLNFDFAAGTLGGYMDPHLNGPMETPEVPRYNFVNTIFSPGSTTFSGSFDAAGPTPSSFEGQFTGPAAQELMATFRAPYFDSFSESWGEIRGVMAGKR